MTGRGAKAKGGRGLVGPKAKKTISLALQGGGAHGAFTWGVLDRLIEDGRLGFEAITGFVAFYAWAVDEAWVGDERAAPQPGHFYGGWVTSKIVGPIKGEPGSHGW
jgi:hypothetical protein